MPMVTLPAEAEVPGIPWHTPEKTNRLLMWAYVLASFGSWMALITPIAVTLTLRVHAIDPVNGPSSLGLITGIGALFPLVGPLIGQLSDRTTARIGMRRPWIITGAVGSVVALLVVATAPTIPLLLVGWCLMQLLSTIAGAGTNALIPDQFPAFDRGKLSGYVGMAQQLAILVGIAIGQLVNGNLVLAFMIPAIIGCLTQLLLALVVPDRRLPKAERQPLHLFGFLKGYWFQPTRHPDFAFTLAARFVLGLGFAIYGTYGTFFLIDHLHVAANDVYGLLLIAAPIGLFVAILGAVISGIWSDRQQRRKPFIIVASFIYLVGMVLIANATAFPLYLVGGTIATLGIAIFSAIDIALGSQVLPDNGAHAAKDMGIFNIASALPQSLAPTLAPLILAIGSGHNYVALYLIAGSVGILGAVLTLPIKGVR